MTSLWQVIALLVLLLTSIPIKAQQRVVINEVMFAPVSPEPEWIEVWNISKDTVDISGWSVSVGHYNPRVIPKGSSPVAPNSIVVLTSKDSILAAIRKVPENKIIYAPLNQLSNNGTTISLRDTSGMLVDSINYDGSWIRKNGISIERIDEWVPGYDANNWKACEDTSGNTILQPNSARKLAYDLALANPVITDTNVTVQIINRGRDTAYSPRVELAVSSDTISWSFGFPIEPNHSTSVTFPLPEDYYGKLACTTYLCTSNDERRSNDTIRCIVNRSIPRDSLVINEIMFDPASNDCQWIELANRTSKIISLDSLKLVTGSSRPGIYSFGLPAVNLEPNDYAIIAANDSFMNMRPNISKFASLGRSSLDLGKDSCYIVQQNPNGGTIDSLHYFGSWQQSLVRGDFTGISLERKSLNRGSNDATNWQACYDTAGSTPLRQNSAATLSDHFDPASAGFDAHFAPNPFSPDADGFEDESILTVQTNSDDEWALRARLFDTRGRMVRTLADAASVYRTIAIHFDGRNDNGQLLTPGLYTALVEVTAHNPTRSLKKAIGIAIAGKRK